MSPDSPYGPLHVLRTGVSELVSDIPATMIEAMAHDAEHLQILRGLELRSYLCVPLKTQERVLGAVTFVTTAESGRHYTDFELGMAEDLAYRAAVAIENAAAVPGLREADHRKDEFLAMLAHELRNPLAPIQTRSNCLHPKRMPARPDGPRI